MTKDETIALIEHMRSAGACRVRVGDVEVQWTAPPVPSSREPAERQRPEEVARLRREQEDAILFAASG